MCVWAYASERAGVLQTCMCARVSVRTCSCLSVWCVTLCVSVCVCKRDLCVRLCVCERHSVCVFIYIYMCV